MVLRVVITGSSSGLGAFLAERLLADGHRVWGLARRDQSAAVTPAFQASRCDVTDWDAVVQVAGDVEARWGGVEALVCCAGVQGAVGPAMTLNPRAWSDTVRANVDGTYFALRAFHRLLARTNAPRAKVVCVSGGGATSGRRSFSAYACAKTAIVRLVETLNEELSASAIDVNAVAPGALRTRLTEEVAALGPQVVGPEEHARALEVLATGGGSLDKVYALVAFLLSSRSDGVGGRLLAAQWDPWQRLEGPGAEHLSAEACLLRRVMPEGWR